MIPALHVRLLGGFYVAYDGRPVTTLNAARLQSVLAYLILHRQTPQSRRYLAFLFWPDSTEAQAHVNLRNILHRLHHALPEADHVLRVDSQTVQWQPDIPICLDVADFETAIIGADQTEAMRDSAALQAALERAVSLYQGDLLPDCYDDWILPERERWREMMLGALARLIILSESRFDYRTAIHYAQQLLRHDPLQEATYRHLMRLYALSGDRVNALRTYQTCVAVLEQELAVEPSLATLEAYEQLWSNRPPPVSIPENEVLSPSTNLPFQLTSFIGREREIVEVKRLLTGTRLLTLTGPGGGGKTRLALEVANTLLVTATFPDGVWWVELATLSDPALVPQLVATALNIHELPNRTLMETLGDFLRSKHLLLLLDNCEHLAAACAQLAEMLLRTCAHVRILATSRESLGLTGEVSWPVPPLTLPPHSISMASRESELAFEQLKEFEAIHLFVDRANAVIPTFNLTSHNVIAVAQVCCRLDGIPLAIELAAARVKILTVEQLVSRLDDRFNLLGAGSRTALPRHQTLRATIDWSYDLLVGHERLLFHRLSVFSGGFSLEAAETVCADENLESARILELLAHLVDKSLVMVEDQGAQVRYRFLETIRQYAGDKLLISGERERLLNRHFYFFLELAEEAEPNLTGADQVIWLNRLEQDHDNLRTALEWSLTDHDLAANVTQPELFCQATTAEAGLRLAGALWRFWFVHGYLNEGRMWLERVLAGSHLPAGPARSKALNGAGVLAHMQGDYKRAAALHQESLAICQQQGTHQGVAYALHYLGVALQAQGDYAQAAADYADSLAIFRALPDQRGIAITLRDLGEVAANQGNFVQAVAYYEEALSLRRKLADKHGIARVLNNLGAVVHLQGKSERAGTLYEESLILFRELGDTQGIANSLYNLGDLANHQANYRRALELFRESLMLFRQLGDKHGLILCLEGLAKTGGALGDTERAVHLCGAVEVLRSRNGIPRPLARCRQNQHWLTAIQTELSQENFAVMWAFGQAMTLEQALEYALTV